MTDNLDQRVKQAADYFNMIDAAYQQALGNGDPFKIKAGIHAWEVAYAEYNTLKRKQFNRNQARQRRAAKA